ncbi:MAG: hypothetical protein H0U73_08465 [Tatlockia sp.]|nr:hypothetical protein [Tatlockia sp.]
MPKKEAPGSAYERDLFEEFTQPEFLFLATSFLFETSPLAILFSIVQQFSPPEGIAQEFSFLTNGNSFFSNFEPEIVSNFSDALQFDMS